LSDFKLAEGVPISKADAERQMVFGWANVPEPGASPVAKAAAGSMEDRLERIRGGFVEECRETDEYWDSYVYATYDSFVIAECWSRGGVKYVQVPFSADADDDFEFDFDAATEVALTFVAKALENGAHVFEKQASASKAKVDLQGDVIYLNDLETAAYDFVLKSRLGDADHERIAGVMVESFMATEEKYLAMGIPADVVKTLNKGWWIGFKVDDAAWEGVKNGTYKMFSVFGAAKTEEIEV